MKIDVIETVLVKKYLRGIHQFNNETNFNELKLQIPLESIMLATFEFNISINMKF